MEPISFQTLRSFARKEKRTVSSDELRIPTRCSYFPDLVTSQIPGLLFKVFTLGSVSGEQDSCGTKGTAVGRRAEPGRSPIRSCRLEPLQAEEEPQGLD